MLENWAVVPAHLPLVTRCCHTCSSEQLPASNEYRVAATRTILDAWLLALCAACREPAQVTVLDRMRTRLHTTRGPGPAVHRLRRPDGGTSPGAGRAMPHSYRSRLGQRLASRHRRIGSF